MQRQTLLHKKSYGSQVFDIFIILLMLLFAVSMLYPFINIGAVSLSSPDEISMGRVTWYPRSLNFEGYRLVLQEPLLLRAYLNTIIYAALSTVFTLLLTSLLAYTLSIKEFCLKKQITIFLAVTMFFNGGLIPTYLLIRNLQMVNTVWAMVVPGCVSAFNVIIFRTFFQEQSVELRESAYLDGANDFVILFRIILPLSKALLATFALFTIVGQWNGWFSALIYLTDDYKQPIQMILRKILMNQTLASDEKTQMLIANMRVHPKNIQMAAIVFTVLPILCIYPFLQKYFAKGITIGSVKG